MRRVRVTCSHPGCKEFSHYEFYNLREAEAHDRRTPFDQWKCDRHVRIDEVLTQTARVRMTEYEAKEIDLGVFWGGTSGFMSGPGFRVWSADFPPGTKLRVTAEVILPD